MFDIYEIDGHITFLRDEATKLRALRPQKPWMLSKADKFDAVAETLREIRQSQQMRGLHGQRLE